MAVVNTAKLNRKRRATGGECPPAPGESDPVAKGTEETAAA
jgi:hypothetical protein